MIKLTDVMREMYESGECDKIINYLKKKHRYIEMRKAKHDKKVLGAVAEHCKNISHIPVIHELKSVEFVKDLYCLYEMEILKEQKND